ncbi:glycosyltransferase family 15 protein [Ascoidea rubescens DSM 1968]|uniref:Glycosyltransferase family 15 protein n=1 Tax=Ascoidea rubescens DSM 1968 TaxID=1344418 RepID=A0A1D2VL56_9ASCO|nr:glycosyltransferase family 15 protein [Ascoidea rubescens DSM 1968]ODV62338.1 glycosyltransferase family 15 protein [Ascoidea rubescens DSM 1968]
MLYSSLNTTSQNGVNLNNNSIISDDNSPNDEVDFEFLRNSQNSGIQPNAYNSENTGNTGNIDNKFQVADDTENFGKNIVNIDVLNPINSYDFDVRSRISNYKKQNATLFTLVRDEDLYGILTAIRNVEDRFNKNYHYDWIFANNQEFSNDFKIKVSNLVSGNSKFIKIPNEYWSYPEWIDQLKARKVRAKMKKLKIKYGHLESYRHMCRFNSGFFYRLPELLNYKYYWRVEPDVNFRCDINYDPFKYMNDNNKTYGFTMAPYELHTTVRNLWSTVLNFTSQYPEYVADNNNFEFLTDDNGETFNMCHFWSNFEIADMDFYREEAYSKFFEFIDKSGGFFYERWGDAPIHSMAVSIFLNKDKLHYFDNFGYYHPPNGQCPRSFEERLKRRCDCDGKRDYNWSQISCIPLYFELNGLEKPNGPTKQRLKSHKFNYFNRISESVIEEVHIEGQPNAEGQTQVDPVQAVGKPDTGASTGGRTEAGAAAGADNTQPEEVIKIDSPPRLDIGVNVQA